MRRRQHQLGWTAGWGGQHELGRQHELGGGSISWLSFASVVDTLPVLQVPSGPEGSRRWSITFRTESKFLRSHVTPLVGSFMLLRGFNRGLK